MKKKKVLIHTDFSIRHTGFGKHARNILTYLYQTNKYELINYCCGEPVNHSDASRTPWKTIGSIPINEAEVQSYLNDFPPEQREPRLQLIRYGDFYLDKVMMEEKPDVYIGIQDIWGLVFAIDKFWFPKIHSVIWTTLDSLPLLPMAVEKAINIKHYWIWSDFAVKEMHRLGHTHVKTMHGAINPDQFYRLDHARRMMLRKRFNIDPNAFIIGFVFRNQLRKSVPNLLEGYNMWCRRNPTVKSKLLLHTSFAEGWNIHRLAAEYGVNKQDILTTYVCQHCRNYMVRDFVGQNISCGFCGSKDGVSTTNVSMGVHEDQLNEVYNLMDVYCHPFTSGGQEIPIEEAKLTELITLVTNYSCGEEACQQGAGSLPLDWAEYREHGTEFRKASTLPSSICKQLDKVYNMTPNDRLKLGRIGKQWVIDNFSLTSVGKQLEAFLDQLEPINFDYVPSVPEVKDPSATVSDTPENSKWILSLYKNILKMDVNEQDQGYQYWFKALANGMPRQQVETYFRHVATEENKKNKKISFEELLDKDDAGKRILFVLPESIGDIFMATSLFKSIKQQYPDMNLYVATKPEYHSVLAGNPYVHKVLAYLPQMDNQLWLEGIGQHPGFFKLSFHPYFSTQRLLNYVNNGETNIAVDLKLDTAHTLCT